MKEASYIDTYTHDYLHPSDKVRTQRMYFLKKLHKNPHGIRPIVSGCSGPTERISSFLDHIIKPLVPTIPSHIKDSPHLISLLENTPIPSNAILATMDCIDRNLVGIMHDLRASYIPSLPPSPSPTPPPNIPRLVTTYSPHYTSLLHLLKKHWSLVQNDPSLTTFFPTPPQLCYRRNPTLADSLVKASLPGSRRQPTGQVPPIPITRLDSRMVCCADKRCKVCPRAEGRRVLFSTVSNTPMRLLHVQIHPSFICIVCNKCGKLYIGLTSNSLKVRFRAHRHFSETKRRVPLPLAAPYPKHHFSSCEAPPVVYISSSFLYHQSSLKKVTHHRK